MKITLEIDGKPILDGDGPERELLQMLNVITACLANFGMEAGQEKIAALLEQFRGQPGWTFREVEPDPRD